MAARKPYFNPRAPPPQHHPRVTQPTAISHPHRPPQPIPGVQQAQQAQSQHHAPMGYVSGQSLQSHPFPGCVIEVLKQIVQFIRQHGVKWTRVKSTDLQSRIEVDLFCLSADRKTSRLNEVQKLKLIGIICNFFCTDEHSKDRQLRRLYFDVIFCGREGETQLHETRITFLTKFTVMFLQYPVYILFDDIAQWLNKIGGSKQYGERIVAELCDGFLSAPKRYAMHEYLLPLQKESAEFAAIFITHSVAYVMGRGEEGDGRMKEGLALVIGEWLNGGLSKYLSVLEENAHLAEKFVSKVQSFPLMLGYDSINPHEDEVHDRFHFVVTSILLSWPTITSTRKPAKPVASSYTLTPNCLLDILFKSATLDSGASDRLADNLKSLVSTHIVSIEEVRTTATMCNTKDDILVKLLSDI